MRKQCSYNFFHSRKATYKPFYSNPKSVVKLSVLASFVSFVPLWFNFSHIKSVGGEID